MLRKQLISPFAFAFLFSIASLSLAGAARAQVSDAANRAAARELATQGIQLQQEGNFTEALDRFNRAQAVFSAPTHLLHIAQCEVALGKLVEGAETYRTLVRTPLPAGAPSPFVQAQQQGAAELSQVEPRIPSIRVIVRPRVIPGSRIYIDGKEISAALVGVQRPTDPGAHAVVLDAPGYARASQQIVLAEKETKDVAFNLGGAGGYYSPPPAATTASATGQPPPPPPYTPQPLMPPREHEEARAGFLIGAAAGLLLPAGNGYKGTALSSLAGPGASVSVDAGVRFVKRLYAGVRFEHGFLGAGSTLTNQPSGGSANADSNYIGIDVAYLSNPDGAAFFGEIGAGYRFLDLNVQGTGTSSDGSATLQGGEVSLGVGVHFKAGDWIRLVPLASLSAGQFGSINCSGGNILSGYQCGSISNGDTHIFVLLGMTVFVDFTAKH